MPSDRIRHMLDYLITRNALAYQYFLESLVLTGNVLIANALEPSYSTSEQCRRLIEREMIQPSRHTTTATTSGTTSNSSSSQQQQQQQQPDDHNLQYPTTCSQNHPHVDTADATLFGFHPSLHLSAFNSATAAAAAAATSAGVFYSSEQQHQHLHAAVQHHRRPPFHPNHHPLMMRRLATYTATPLSLSSRSNSSNGFAAFCLQSSSFVHQNLDFLSQLLIQTH